ncbi:LacI family DNA-binding transcriptional regulator [Phytohabitans aurantiacus]|uniref:LacI family transcriptional regulator n=1 Tax=Phytohabitans aurantiacus TaxID=3016789 RepID=A0ABQ5RAM2_9ACTN|nr:substrate-binding domain-containing protein [Phytohabitans aurantiacus]GLI03273.1 LacI family transcriptional regulator [Phytohabitans aurantiacus]
MDGSDEGSARPLTIAAVAKAAGVSVPTVSRVLNGEADVSAETRARIEAVIRAGGYRRQERDYHASLIELVFHELIGPWAIPTIRGVEQVATDHEMSVVLSELRGRHSPRDDWVQHVLARRPAGVISVFCQLSAAQRRQLGARNIAVVVIDPTERPAAATPAVAAANRQGGATATDHLLALGHRRIAMINGPARIWCCQEREAGFRDAMAAAGVAIDPHLVRYGNLHVDEGQRIGAELLALPEPPTAIFAGNDLQAMGVYQAARAARVRIPEDLSVVGFDDVPVAGWMGPALTTVRQPLTDMGVAAAGMLLTLAGGAAPVPPRVELPTTLVLRGSTTPLP